MSGRTPSFIVVGLVIIMFLLGLFYMSCSSKNTELRLSLEQFEERIRSLTITNSDSEKKIENIMTRKRELEEDKSNIQRQMEKKDSEINDLNTKLNEKHAELQSLKSDKNVVDEQLKEYKSMSETIATKDSLIGKLQQQLNDQKQSGNDELTRLRQEYETLKNNQPSQNNQLSSNNEQQDKFPIPPQRFRPFLPNNLTTKSIASLFRDPLNRLNNLTKEVQAEFVPAALDLKDKVLNAFGVNTNYTTTTISNDQQQADQNVAAPPPLANNVQQVDQNVAAPPPLANNVQQVDQNVRAPPLANNAQRRQQPDHVESAQAAPVPNERNQPVAALVDNSQYQQRVQRSINNSISDDNEIDDEEQPVRNNVQDNPTSTSKIPQQDDLENDNHNPPIDVPSLSKVNDKNYRNGNREQFPQEQKFNDGGEVDDEQNNDKEDAIVLKRHVL